MRVFFGINPNENTKCTHPNRDAMHLPRPVKWFKRKRRWKAITRSLYAQLKLVCRDRIA